mgnify:CR=1 FL=1
MTHTLGIEFGSTRIKAVLIDEAFRSVASGDYTWKTSATASGPMTSRRPGAAFARHCAPSVRSPWMPWASRP